MLKQDYMALIKKRMSEKRYLHSLNVAKEAVRLSALYGADPVKAEVAGLLHDITKETPPDEQLQIMRRSGIMLSVVEQNSQKLWHAISGAAYLRDTLRIEDPDILNAVRYHTTGRAGMSLLEKVIFVADFTGAERCYDGVEIMREKAERSLEEAMLFGLSFSIADLARRALAIDPNALAAYNQILTENKKHDQ
ncbi:MAG TPA: bis(5'-nucleosyl)-tetraphosphatase (symmetrical) YqeK [Candidatus Scatovicinus merdipullorum]|nr:bis(5'-nucleosyl)-tetraphosphatase (symmetrical) YqeK [Candidatus Scatovicinus merdipullorum]